MHARSLAALSILALAPLTSGLPSSTADGDRPTVPPIDCPTSVFSEVSASPANDQYAAPRLVVACNEHQLLIESNGIPSYEYEARSPNGLRTQEHAWALPLRPQLGESNTALPLLGTVAVAVNGIPIYGPNEGPMPHPFGDPVYNRMLDRCAGHTARRGDYHYHALLKSCLGVDTDSGGADPVIAYALDGFPIYGPGGCADAACSVIITYESSWQRTGDPTTHAWDAYEYVERDEARFLDACNGHLAPSGQYHYHATATFPYALGCYSGSDTSAVRAEPVPGGGDPRGRRPPRRG